MSKPSGPEAVNWLRAIWTLLRLLGSAFCSASVLVLGSARRGDLLSRARWLQRACQATLRILRVSIRTHGPPPRNAIIVANHLGYIDVLAFAALTPTVFIAKREIAYWLLLGWFARRAGTRFIDRSNRADVVRVGHELTEALAAGVNVLVFLEGTSTDGRGVLPFRPSLLEPVVRNNCVVAPAAMAFAVPPRFSPHDDVCWWGGMTLMPHVWKLARIPWIEARVAWGESFVAAGDRKQLAVDLREKVIALLESIGGATPGHDAPKNPAALTGTTA